MAFRSLEAFGDALRKAGELHVVSERVDPRLEISEITNRVVKAGDGFVVPAGVKHDAHNTGSAPLKLVGVYVVEKGKPLATPAP